MSTGEHSNEGARKLRDVNLVAAELTNQSRKLPNVELVLRAYADENSALLKAGLIIGRAIFGEPKTEHSTNEPPGRGASACTGEGCGKRASDDEAKPRKRNDSSDRRKSSDGGPHDATERASNPGTFGNLFGVAGGV